MITGNLYKPSSHNAVPHQAHMQLGQRVRAEAALAELNRQVAHAYSQQMQLVTFLVQHGAYHLAIVQFKQLLRSRQDPCDLNYTLALAYHRAGEEDHAAAQIRKMLVQGDKTKLQNLLGDSEAAGTTMPRHWLPTGRRQSFSQKARNSNWTTPRNWLFIRTLPGP